MSVEFVFSEEEKVQVIKAYFKDGVIQIFPSKIKKQYIALAIIAEMFAKEHEYTEVDINDILRKNGVDYVMLRRYLVDYGFLHRDAYGKTYIVSDKLK